MLLPVETETLLADRVELAARILRQSSVSATYLKNTLLKSLRESIQLLANYGSPITQVKMLRSCQNIPDINLIEALRKPLNSPVEWVRGQALILIASSQSSARAVGSEFATELGFDLANGVFPARLPTYFKAVSASSNRTNWLALGTGIVCYIIYIYPYCF